MSAVVQPGDRVMLQVAYRTGGTGTVLRVWSGSFGTYARVRWDSGGEGSPLVENLVLLSL